jgi:2'-5' RNA ligase
MEDKRYIETIDPGAAYGSHPPHMTLIFTHLKSIDQVDRVLKKETLSIEPLQIQFDQTLVFESDPMTSGGHTLAYRCQSHPRLMELQKRLAFAIEPYIHHTTAPEIHFDHPDMNESFTRFKFPFIGSHWIPHMTVASPKLSIDHPYIKNFKEQNVNYSETVQGISLWKIEGDHHTPFHHYPFVRST